MGSRAAAADTTTSSPGLSKETYLPHVMPLNFYCQERVKPLKCTDKPSHPHPQSKTSATQATLYESSITTLPQMPTSHPLFTYFLKPKVTLRPSNRTSTKHTAYRPSTPFSEPTSSTRSMFAKTRSQTQNLKTHLCQAQLTAAKHRTQALRSPRLCNPC